MAAHKGKALSSRRGGATPVAPRASTSTRTFEAFAPRANRRQVSTPPFKQAEPTGRGYWSRQLLLAGLGGFLLAGLVALILNASAPRDPWVFDRPEAKLPSPQARHAL